MLVPAVHEVQPPLLHPSVKILRSDRIGILHDLVFRSKYLDGSLFDANSLAAGSHRIWRVMPRVENAGALVVLHQQRTSARDIIEQPTVIGADITTHVVGANAENNG